MRLLSPFLLKKTISVLRSDIAANDTHASSRTYFITVRQPLIRCISSYFHATSAALQMTIT
jgi:hypothetical protein